MTTAHERREQVRAEERAERRKSDDFTDDALKEARKRVQGDSRFAHTTRDLLVGMAEWALDHLAEQEPTDAEVEAAAKAMYRNPEGWDLMLAAYRRRVEEQGPVPDHVIAHRLELARDALTAARTVRQEKR